MNIQKCFGINLKRIRKSKGFSQEDLAEGANLHRTYISFLERGMRNPSLLTIEKLADCLDVHYSEFFKEDI